MKNKTDFKCVESRQPVPPQRQRRLFRPRQTSTLRQKKELVGTLLKYGFERSLTCHAFEHYRSRYSTTWRRIIFILAPIANCRHSRVSCVHKLCLKSQGTLRPNAASDGYRHV